MQQGCGEREGGFLHWLGGVWVLCQGYGARQRRGEREGEGERQTQRLTHSTPPPRDGIAQECRHLRLPGGGEALGGSRGLSQGRGSGWKGWVNPDTHQCQTGC